MAPDMAPEMGPAMAWAANYKGAVSGYGLINPRNSQAILSVSYMRWKFAN